jgi:hypothetical protein
MKLSSFTQERERIVARALRPVASELRMIDPADFIAMLRYECHADLADIVASAAELFFQPGTVTLGMGGDYQLEWGEPARIVLDLELRPHGVTVFARLTLEDHVGAVELNHVAFDRPMADPDDNTCYLEQSLAAAAFKKTAPAPYPSSAEA